MGGAERAPRTREIRIEAPERLLGIASGVALEPEPIPLGVTAVLVGDRVVYQLLCELDPEFRELFAIAADFDDAVERTPQKERDLARRIATIARREAVRPLRRSAVERLVEHASRAAGDATRLSTSERDLLRVLREAQGVAAAAGRPAIVSDDVEAALAAREARDARVRDEILRAIARGTILVDVRGSAVGQVNALSVFRFGECWFGHPSRVTARVRLGRGR